MRTKYNAPSFRRASEAIGTFRISELEVKGGHVVLWVKLNHLMKSFNRRKPKKDREEDYDN